MDNKKEIIKAICKQPRPKGRGFSCVQTTFD